MKKVCFVVMGFGKKMDYRNAKEVDLDIIYNKVIKEVFESDFKEYELIRADEISGSEIIDVSMYTLLLKADLVVADITTMNENAIYELGVRHALKPFSTIIMLQQSEGQKIPFDLSHNRICTYDDYGEELDDSEAAKIKEDFKKFIVASEKHKIDSPLYTYLPNVEPPVLSDEEYSIVLEEVRKKESTISELVQRAEDFKKKSDFVKATREWKELHELLPGNDYITQQYALCRYKSKAPNETMALQEALGIINKLNPQKSLDLETLGITGAIYKRLYMLNRNYDYLEEAAKMYQKGYVIKRDYYNGENYANCLLFKTQQQGLENEEIIFLRFQSKKVYKEIIEILEASIAAKEINYWMYATLSTSYYCVGDEENYIKYREMFEKNVSAEWEKESYLDNLQKIAKCLGN